MQQQRGANEETRDFTKDLPTTITAKLLAMAADATEDAYILGDLQTQGTVEKPDVASHMVFQELAIGQSELLVFLKAKTVPS